jgi:hypothetical protein
MYYYVIMLEVSAYMAIINRIILIILTIAICMALSSCSPQKIPDQTEAYSVDEPVNTEPSEILDVSNSSEAFSAYLTTYHSSKYTEEFPYLVKFNSYSEVEEYFYSHERDFFFGARFTIACASFSDDYLADNDVMMLVIDEPSTYASFECKNVTVENGKTVFDIERHIPQNAPQGSSIAYHLVFTAPKGSYDYVDTDNFSVNITEVTDNDTSDVFDAERFRYIYPEFWPSSHKADALDEVSPVIISIHSYDELLGFYENQKSDFDLDSEFLPQIGFSYTEELFNDYVLLMALMPFDSRYPPPTIQNVFVYNMKIWISINNYAEQIPEDKTVWYLLTAAVAKRDLEGIDLNQFNIGGTVEKR